MRSSEKGRGVAYPRGPQNGGVERSGRGRIAGGFRGLAGRLFAPVDIASLAYFRIAFGVIMLWEVWRYFNYGWISDYYIEPIFHFSYYGFGWVQPWPGIGMYIHFAALGVLAACIALGLFYRVAALLFFLGFSYVFLLDQTQYLNHFYFVCLVSLLMIFVPAHRAFSVDARQSGATRSETVPAWAPAILALQMGIVYFYGGIAKINADWLRGEPMGTWMAAGADYPVVGALFTHPWAGYFFSYGGLFLDLLVVPFLLWKRTRLAAFLVVTGFHLTNAWMFQIGIFPWFAIAATAMFFPPSWPRRSLHFLHGLWDPAAERRRKRQRERELQRELRRERSGALGSSPEGAHDGRGEPAGVTVVASGASLGITPGAVTRTFRNSPGSRRGAIVALLVVFVAVQLLMPLRHFAYPGNVSWTEEGHRFAWHMKLRSVEGIANFRVTDTQSGQVMEVDNANFLTERQEQKMAYQPDMLLQFAHALEDAASSAGYGEVEVRAEVLAAMNGRDSQRLIDPNVDLTQETRSLAPADWIIPLREPLPTPG